MRRGKVLLAVAAIASLLVLPSAKTFADGNVVWTGLTIQQKKTAIINNALSYAIGSFGGECKVWVQNVVYAASNHVLLPQNNPAPYDYYWQTDYHYHVAPQWGRTIENVERGDMVQMHLTNGYPHTIIILYNDVVSGTIKFRESNVPLGSGKVNERIQTYAQFKAAVTGYTIYWIM